VIPGLYRRVHFYGGNCLRALTSPWKQHRISPDEAATIFGCSYGDRGWHHLRRTLEEYDANPGIDYRDTTLYRYLTGFRPASICDFLAGAGMETCRLPLFVYPWGTFKEGEIASAKSAESSRFCGPSTPGFAADEFARTIRMYESMKRTGYTPWSFPHTFIGGTMLRARNGARRFIVLQGNHRLAILAHMGSEQVDVRDWPGYMPVVRESDVEKWPLVTNGTCSIDAARAIFRLLFESTGFHVAARLPALGHRSPG
jgi:hypothetical protein